MLMAKPDYAAAATDIAEIRHIIFDMVKACCRCRYANISVTCADAASAMADVDFPHCAISHVCCFLLSLPRLFSRCRAIDVIDVERPYDTLFRLIILILPA